MHRKIIGLIQKYSLNEDVQQFIIGEPLVVCPREWENKYPAAHYEFPPERLGENGRKIFITRLKKFFNKINGDYESSNIWKIDPTFDKTHSAVFPIELCNKIIKFYSFKGDLVFDPFAGSGTFGKSAINLNRFFFLTEQQQKYIDRIKENVSQIKIFSDNTFKPRFLKINEFKKVIKNDDNIN